MNNLMSCRAQSRHLVTAFFLILTLFSSCTKRNSRLQSQNPQIVATIFPIYDWLSEITKGSDTYDLSLLVGNGTDLHSFQASASDIIKIKTSDVFVYVGGESDEWIEEVLSGSKNEKLRVVKLLDFIKPLQEEELFQDGGASKAGTGDFEIDEHIWLSVKNAVLIVEKLSEILCEIEPSKEKSVIYKENAASYIEKLSTLDRDFSALLPSFSKNAILVCDRFPFLYLVKDYGIEYFAAFQGCSAETDASFETVAFLTKKIDELNLDYVFVIDSGNEKLSKTIIANSNKKGAEILTLDSLQSVTKKEIESGKNYLDSMTSNFETLSKSLR